VEKLIAVWNMTGGLDCRNWNQM